MNGALWRRSPAAKAIEECRPRRRAAVWNCTRAAITPVAIVNRFTKGRWQCMRHVKEGNAMVWKVDTRTAQELVQASCGVLNIERRRPVSRERSWEQRREWKSRWKNGVRQAVGVARGVGWVVERRVVCTGGRNVGRRGQVQSKAPYPRPRNALSEKVPALNLTGMALPPRWSSHARPVLRQLFMRETETPIIEAMPHRVVRRNGNARCLQRPKERHVRCAAAVLRRARSGVCVKPPP